jgi:hypothetical protein
MLMDYELKGQQHHFFIESSAEKEVIESLLVDYRKEDQVMLPERFILFSRSFGYRMEELTSSDAVEAFFHFDGLISAHDFKKQRIRESLQEQYFKLKGYEDVDFEAGTAMLNGETFDFYLFSHLSSSGATYDSIVGDRNMLQNILENIDQMKAGADKRIIVIDQIVEYQEQFEQDEVAHVDHKDSDEAVTFSDVLRLVIFTVPEKI